MAETAQPTVPENVVYQFSNGSFGSSDQVWIAMAEDGEVICSHVSSSREWGIHDTSHRMHGKAYAAKYGDMFEVRYIVLPEGEIPPKEVRDRNAALASVSTTEVK